VRAEQKTFIYLGAYLSLAAQFDHVPMILHLTQFGGGVVSVFGRSLKPTRRVAPCYCSENAYNSLGVMCLSSVFLSPKTKSLRRAAKNVTPGLPERMSILGVPSYIVLHLVTSTIANLVLRKFINATHASINNSDPVLVRNQVRVTLGMEQVTSTRYGGEPDWLDATELCRMPLDGGGARRLSTLCTLKAS